MTTYEVSFLKNDVYQACLVRTEKSPVELGHWFAENNPGANVIGISIATSDSMKPGKPFVTA